MISYFERMFSYDAWANNLIAHALDALATEAPSASSFSQTERLFAHVVGASQVWYDRVTGAPARTIPYPDWQLERAIEESRAMSLQWSSYLSTLSDSQLEQPIAYRNSQGEQVSVLQDILAHVVNHGTHHRAQIARALRESGSAPPVLDFIAYAREHPILL